MIDQPIKIFTNFSGGSEGQYKIISQQTIIGDPLPLCTNLKVDQNEGDSSNSDWMLRGIVSNLRYTNSSELSALKEIQPVLGRKEASVAAFIPIKKSAAWWELAQDERRKIMEDKSKHIATGFRFLPAIARKLYHCKDIGGEFDFLTWFEFDPANETAFDELLGALRQSEEWTYVTRELEFRMLHV